MTDEYSKREIDMIKENLKEEMLTSHKNIQEKLDLILSQTTKTNGRVNKLENWQSYLVGAWVVVSIFVIPTIIYVYTQDKNEQNSQIIDNQKEIKELIKKV